MISVARTNRKRPRWIKETLWKTMVDYWNTEDAMERSKNASIARNSPRGDFGPPKHLSGQKSYLQIQQEMEDELGRPVTIGEVFIKTHTRADGTYVDLKAKQIGEAYEKNLEEMLVEVDPSETSDGTSQRLPLTPDEMNEIFIQSTIPDERGRPYGLGSLQRIPGNGKRKRSSRVLYFSFFWQSKNNSKLLNTKLKSKPLIMLDVIMSLLLSLLDVMWSPLDVMWSPLDLRQGNKTGSTAWRWSLAILSSQILHFLRTWPQMLRQLLPKLLRL